MACGPASCTCVIQHGDNVVVDGSGSAADPYIISSGPGVSAGKTTVTDTPSVDMVITGTGVDSDPYIVSGNAKYSADVNNCARAGSDGGIFAPCFSVDDGDDVLITGTGTTADPFRPNVKISTDADNCITHGVDGGLYSPCASAGAGQTTVADTGTIDSTIIGAGTSASPYVISSQIILSDDDDNCATTGVDGGLYVACNNAGTSTTALVPLDTTTVDTEITGTGDVMDPYVISANARISAEVNNCLSDAGDGLYVECPQVEGDGVTTSVTGVGTADDPFIVVANPPTVDCAEVRACIPAPVALDTATVDMVITGTGEPGDPYVFSANSVDTTVIAPVGPGTDVTGTGTAVDPYVVAVDPGCGVLITPTNEVAVATSGTWPLIGADGDPFPCADTEGGQIYCDSAGQLRGLPEHYSQTSGLVQINDQANQPITALGVTSTNNMVTFANPSTCRTFVGQILARSVIDVQWTQPVGRSRIGISMQSSLNGGPFTQQGVFTHSGNPGDEESYEHVIYGSVLIPPGGTITFQNRVVATLAAGTAPTQNRSAISILINGATT